MGIPRFTSFVDNTFTGWQREEITGNLIIDGYSMCYNLYSFDWSHGGQYPEYQGKVAQFFILMRQCGITPIVVLDGIDYKEEKTHTILRRRSEVIKTIHKYTASIQKRNIEAVVDHILPPLAFSVFITVMIDLKVKFIVADGEGDVCIYQLANAYSCPVLSADSDFLMYKLKGGYIPFNRFHWEASPINAEVFYYRAFCEQFKFKDESIRLIIAAIAGNDFLPGVDSTRFMSHVARKVAMETKGRNRLISVVRYVQLYESLEDFVDQIESMVCLENDEKKQLRENCQEMQKVYDSDDITTLEIMNKKTELLAFNSEALPEWVLKQFREGNFFSTIMEALVVGRSILGIFIDDTTIESCIHASLPIRQFIYGLTGSSLVTEHYREGLEVVGKGIHSSDSINGRPLPSLDRIPTLGVVNREHLLYAILGCDFYPFQSLGNYWKLVMAATMFWCQNTKPSPHVIKALILSFVICSTCPHELRKMHSEFFIPVTFRRSPKWMPPLHAFAQWQAIYLYTMALNQLLMLPLEPVSSARLYDGKLAMFFVLPENEDHLAGMLPIDHQLYADLVGIILPPQFRPHVTKLPPPHTHRKVEKPPRFQNASRGQQVHPGGGGGGGGRGRGGYSTGSDPRSQGRGHSNDTFDQRRSHVGHNRYREPSGRGQAMSQSHASQVTTQSHASHARNQSSGASRGRSKKATVSATVPQSKIVITKPPRFTHANRYATLGGDEEGSEDDSF